MNVRKARLTRTAVYAAWDRRRGLDLDMGLEELSVSVGELW